MNDLIKSMQAITEDMHAYYKRYSKEKTTPKEYGMALNKRGKRRKTVKGGKEH